MNEQGEEPRPADEGEEQAVPFSSVLANALQMTASAATVRRGTAPNPASSPTMALSLPKEMKIRLVQANAVEDLDLLNVGVAITLALMIAFGTSYFVSPHRPKHLLWEAVGWAALLVFFVGWMIKKRLSLRSETFEMPLDFTVGGPVARLSGRRNR